MVLRIQRLYIPLYTHVLCVSLKVHACGTSNLSVVFQTIVDSHVSNSIYLIRTRL